MAISTAGPYFVSDRFLGDFLDFPTLKAAVRFAVRRMGCAPDEVGDCVFVERDEAYVPLSKALPSAVPRVVAFANRSNPVRSSRASRRARWHRERSSVERERRKFAWLPKRDRRRIEDEETAPRSLGWGVNPGHPAYAQWLMKLGFPVNDPIIELASAWAAGVDPGTRTIRLAMLSAERWMEARDKRLRSAARSIYNKLQTFLAAEERSESRRQFQHAPRSLTGQPARTNPLPNEHAARLIDPSRVVPGTYRRKNVKGGAIGLLFAKVRGAGRGPRGGSMKLASVRFRAAHYTPAQARAWMRDHDLRPILFEAATNSRTKAWRSEGARAKRTRSRSRRRRRAA